MSILIKGMKIPKNCDNCPCYYETEGVWRNECQVLRKECAISEERPSWCPLVEVQPHGDLIDRDKFIQFIKEHWDEYDQWFVGMLEARPVVLESED